VISEENLNIGMWDSGFIRSSVSEQLLRKRQEDLTRRSVPCLPCLVVGNGLSFAESARRDLTFRHAKPGGQEICDIDGADSEISRFSRSLPSASV